MKTAGILLAAGRSERFGQQNKLLAPFHGSPLISHAAAAMRETPLDFHIAVTNSKEVAALLQGFEIVATSESTPIQSDSLRAGIAAARKHDVSKALIVLGDMPLITSAVLSDLLNRCTTEQASAITEGARRTPPACFPAVMFDQLSELCGDIGAKSLLANLPNHALVRVNTNILMDIDTTTDLSIHDQ